jgi:hypothetical protein
MGALAAQICPYELERQWWLQLGFFVNGAPTFDGIQQDTALEAGG